MDSNMGSNMDPNMDSNMDLGDESLLPRPILNDAVGLRLAATTGIRKPSDFSLMVKSAA
jgi:hypothetical protein